MGDDLRPHIRHIISSRPVTSLDDANASLPSSPSAYLYNLALCPKVELQFHPQYIVSIAVRSYLVHDAGAKVIPNSSPIVAETLSLSRGLPLRPQTFCQGERSYCFAAYATDYSETPTTNLPLIRSLSSSVRQLSDLPAIFLGILERFLAGFAAGK